MIDYRDAPSTSRQAVRQTGTTSDARYDRHRNQDFLVMTRLHDLDALRAFAMLLGIVLHASVFLLPAVDFWPVHDEWGYTTEPEKNPYGYLISVIHGFRMPVFFMISGFFTAMLWQSRGLHQLAQQRLKRIGLPLLVGMFTLIPINAWLFIGSDFKLLYWPVAWLGGFSHLWFLWYLLLMAAALTIAARLGLKFRHPLWWLLIPLTFVPQYFMQQQAFGADTPHGVIPPLRVLGYYVIFFVFGVFFYQWKIAVRRWWTVALLPALTLAFPAGLVLLHHELPPVSEVVWTWVAATALQVAFTWLVCFGLMGLFRCVAVKERFWVRYMSDASYWLYLCHLPLVVGGQMLVLNWPVSVHLKFGLICTVVVAVLLVVYQFGVRYTLIGTMLNGPRTRR